MRCFIRWYLPLFIALVFTAPPLRAQLLGPRDSVNAEDFAHRRILPMVYYSNPDKIFVGLRVRLSKPLHGDITNPTGFLQQVQARYSISQNSFSFLYDARYYNLIDRWNLYLNGYYDWMIWTNFFGLGNDTRNDHPITYYRLSTGEYDANLGINRVFGYHFVDITGFLQGIEVFQQANTLATDQYINDRAYYSEHHIYAGFRAGYTYQNVDNPGIPQKGMMFYLGGGYTENTDDKSKSFARYNSLLQLYVPLFSKFSLSLRGGGSAIIGTPEFFQYLTVGGPMTVRGYLRDRFWGNTSFYNQNELRYITNFDMKFLRGKIGLLALYDDGRVWLQHENSNTLHTAYGGGLLVAPFNRFTLMGTYSVSPEGGIVQLRLIKLLTQIPANPNL